MGKTKDFLKTQEGVEFVTIMAMIFFIFNWIFWPRVSEEDFKKVEKQQEFITNKVVDIELQLDRTYRENVDFAFL